MPPQPGFRGDAWRPATVPNAATRRIAEGGGYRLSVALPDGAPPEGGFPVVYLLDANAAFATLVETNRRLSRRPDATGVLPAIIVGIAHDSDALYDTARRERDYLPHARQADAGGGAEAFLDLLDMQVRPMVEGAFLAHPTRRVLMGHSLAGYFALWAMLRRPGAFTAFAAISPSLWADPTLHAAISTLQGRIDSVFIAAGEWEEVPTPRATADAGAEDAARRRMERQMVTRARAFATALGGRIGDERVQFTAFAEEDHASVFGVALGRAMRAVLPPERLRCR